MSRQDKAISERHTKVLRELVKRPENKTCADCKRNDPRWASWNLGVFLCIRCSGIHRGMGTHISKVKSVDLDVWTPEQMQSITKWGNHLANLYWEARLKPGHIPPEHKMESFIRSKYESRRWAMDGPPPQDPSVLDTSASAAPAPPEPAAAPRQAAAPALSRSAAASSPTTRQPQPHPLLSANFSRATPPPLPSQSVTAPAPAPEPAPAPPSAQNDIFSLDFHAPAATPPPQQQPVKKDVKNDILSLFSAPPPTTHRPIMSIEQNQWGQFGGGGGGGAVAAAPSPTTTTTTSMVGANGVGAWGVSSGWSAPAVAQNTSNLWGAPVQQQQPQQQPLGFAGGFGGMQPQPQVTAQQAALGGANPWGAPAPAAGASHFGGGGDFFSSFAGTPSTTTTTTTTQQQKKDDAFGDLWGSFK